MRKIIAFAAIFILTGTNYLSADDTLKTMLQNSIDSGDMGGVKALFLLNPYFDEYEISIDDMLHYAVAKKQCAIAEYFIEKGADANFADEDNYETLLTLACKSGHLDMVKLLVNKGADVGKALFNGITPLKIAVSGNHIDIAKFLIGKGAHPDMPPTPYYTGKPDAFCPSPIHDAIRNKNKDMIKLLLENNVDINVPATLNRKNVLLSDFPLGFAMTYNVREIAGMLIDNGADLKIRDKYGDTFLHKLMEYKESWPDIILLSIKKGADVNAKNDNAITPLHIAAKRGLEEEARILLENSADVDTEDKDGNTPLKTAKTNKHKNIIELIKKFRGKR